MDGSLGWSSTNPWMVTNQKEVHFKLGIGPIDITHKINSRWQLLWMVTYHPQDGYNSSLGWSPTLKNMVTNLPEDGHPFSKGLSPTIPTVVTHHTHDGPPPYPRWSGHPPYSRWSPTIPTMVTHHPKEGHPPSKIWSPTNPRKNVQKGYSLSQGYGCTPSTRL